jgi:hypothetical protein
MFWSVKEVVQWLECPRDVAALRAASLECREACDATVIRLRPLVLPLPLLRCVHNVCGVCGSKHGLLLSASAGVVCHSAAAAEQQQQQQHARQYRGDC